MSTITTSDGTQLYYKDWGERPTRRLQSRLAARRRCVRGPDVLPGPQGYRCIAHDRRGHGRSSQPLSGYDFDHFADDLSAVIESLDLRDAILVAHSTGGGELTRYIGRHGTSRVAAAVLIGAIPPSVLKTPSNPEGLPTELVDQFLGGMLADRSEFFRGLTDPFYGFNRPGARVSQGLRDSFWQQTMLAGLAGRLRFCRGDCRGGLHRRSQEVRRADAVHARRRRSGRADRLDLAQVVEACSGREAEGLRGPAARHVLDAQGPHQRGSCWSSSRAWPARSRARPAPARSAVRHSRTLQGSSRRMNP